MKNKGVINILLDIVVFAVIWFASLILFLAGAIIVSFLLRNNQAMNLEMGWMAVMLLIPPVIATFVSIPLSAVLIKKINKKIDTK